LLRHRKWVVVIVIIVVDVAVVQRELSDQFEQASRFVLKGHR
jgi:hypothetical protein